MMRQKEEGIGAAILETEGIRGAELLVEGLEAAGIGDHSDAFTAVDPVVVATTRADAGIGAKVLQVDDQAAFRAFAPQAITFIRLLDHLAGGLLLATISEPVEQRHTGWSAAPIKS